MGEKLTIGPINKGLRNDRTAFNIDNDNFPTLVNAYQWRGRVKRRRGTSLLGRLKRFFKSTSVSYTTTSTIVLNGFGVGNLITGFSLETNSSIVPGSAVITAPGPTVYTDQGDGTFLPSGTINYVTGDIVIAAEAGNAVSAVFNYFPDLPVMGLRDLLLTATEFPGTLAFDTKRSYNIQTASPYGIYDVTFYKNPSASALYPGYTAKANATPFVWNGQDYQQFWTVNYQNALWATNGIRMPFNSTNIGMQFKLITNIQTTGGLVIPAGGVGTPAIVRISITAHGLTQGDFIYVNEVKGTTGINFQTGYVVSADPQNANFVDVEFPFADIRSAWTSGGIAQYLTRSADATLDCIRFYDGDPTDGNANTPTLIQGHGWVNFMPPLSQRPFSIGDAPEAIYYLVGARKMVAFKDRLCFFGAVIQSSGGVKIHLQDTVVYSQNGTPYYTCSFINNNTIVDDPTLPPQFGFHQLLVPDNQTATAPAWFEDSTGFGGFLSAGVNQPINTVDPNEDVLIVGFNTIETRFIYTGNDIVPFVFYLINSEYGSSSTFSSIVMDRGVLSRGSRGYLMTNQYGCERFDITIPDQVFQINLNNNGTERITAQRDYINEWLYFTYPKNEDNVTPKHKFPNQTLFYNYREESFAIFNEAYTTYGLFRRQTGFIWSTVGTVYESWQEWNDPWDNGNSTLLNPEPLAGNQQGFVIFRDVGTSEDTSLYIKGFAANVVTSPDHCLNDGDYIVIEGAMGTIGAQVNGKIFSVFDVDQNTFKLNPPIGAGTYIGDGLIKRMYVPLIQTRQFPTAWELGRKTRLGPQMYLFTTTPNGQITVFIFLSQNSDQPYNTGLIVPGMFPVNNSLIYSTILFTCPESANLGLTQFTKNLNTPTAIEQEQIWHRMNTSLIGDTVQLGFTMSDAQMRDVNFNNQFTEIEFHGAILDINQSQLLV